MKNTTDANNATDTLHSQAVNGLLTKIVNEIDKLDATEAYERNDRIYRIERYAAAYANLTQ